MAVQYNPNLPSVKRIFQEARELEREPPEFFTAAPLEDNLFEWHFTVRGPDGTAFEGGRYHGRLLMPSEYPFKPPAIMLLTPNGRFETRKKVCLSISDFHPEQWQPAWGVRTIMTALVAFFPTPADGAIGGLDHTDEERARLAARSLCWSCDACGACMRTALGPAAEPRGAADAAAVGFGAPAAAADADAEAAEAADGGARAGAPATSIDAPACADLAQPAPLPAPLPAPPAGAEIEPAERAPQARSDGGGGEAAGGPVRTGAQSRSAHPTATAAAARADDRLLQWLAYALAAALLALVFKKVLGTAAR